MIPNYSEHAANERTFLAWVRTAVAIVGFGLAAARLADIRTQVWSELLLLGSGAIVIAFAYVRMVSLRKRIASKQQLDDQPLPANSLLVLLVAALMIMLALFAVHVT